MSEYNNSPENIQLLQKVISVMPFGYMKLKIDEATPESSLVIAEANAAAENICNALPGHLTGKLVSVIMPELTIDRLQQSARTERNSNEIFFSHIGKWCTLEVFFLW